MAFRACVTENGFLSTGGFIVGNAIRRDLRRRTRWPKYDPYASSAVPGDAGRLPDQFTDEDVILLLKSVWNPSTKIKPPHAESVSR